MRRRFFPVGIANQGSSIPPITYLLLDRFVTNEAAPMATPRTCEPGPGTLAKTDTGNKWSIASGILSAASATGAGDPAWVSSDTFVKASGLFCYGNYKNMAANSLMGFASAASFGGWVAVFYAHDSVWTLNRDGISLGTWAHDTYYKRVIVQQSDGRYLFLAKGGALSDWKIVGVWTGSYANSKFAIGNYVISNPSFDAVAVGYLPAPYNADYAAASTRVAVTGNNETASGNADGIDEHTITAQTGVSQSFWFRRTTDDETWRVDCDQAGGTIKLYKRTGGVDTEVDAGKTQTWTNGTTYRLVIEHFGNSIRTNVNGTVKNATTDAFNNTAAGVKVSHAGTNLICWPYAAPAALITILDSIE